MTNEKEHHQHIAEYVDIEEYAKAGKEPPIGHKYLIRVDKVFYKVDKECLLGKEILTIAEKNPARFALNVKLHGGVVKRIQNDEEICLCKHHVERFMTMPLDQTEGC